MLKDLRLGNYVNCPNHDYPLFRIDFLNYVTVCDGEAGMHDIGDGELYDLTWEFKDLNPIPLTRQWLIDFKFRPDKFSNDRYNDPTEGGNRYHMMPYKEGSWVFRTAGTSLVQVKYVHELQNVYSTLTGKELVL